MFSRSLLHCRAPVQSVLQASTTSKKKGEKTKTTISFQLILKKERRENGKTKSRKTSERGQDVQKRGKKKKRDVRGLQKTKAAKASEATGKYMYIRASAQKSHFLAVRRKKKKGISSLQANSAPLASEVHPLESKETHCVGVLKRRKKRKSS